jgi:predicted enzyme related to lactoylglutathione lyase
MRIRNITFDCAEPYELASFWSKVVGLPIDPDDAPEETRSHPGDNEVGILPADPGLPMLLFIRVPEGKTVKNRIHLDIGSPTRTRDEEVERIRELGAKVVADHRDPDGSGWVVMADPEGNEFCVERGEAERAAAKV